jgi:hypothetical protein
VSDGGSGDSAGRSGSAGAPAGSGGRAAAGASGGSSVAGMGGSGGMGGHLEATGGKSGGAAHGGAGAGGAAAGAPGGGVGGSEPATRSLLGCGKSSSGYPCGAGSYLWLCPDAAQPVGSYVVPTGSTVTTECTTTGNANEWCCTKAEVILDTRLDPAQSCPPQEKPYQYHDKLDGQYSCIGAL